jgi:hypothetical protein
MILNCTISSTPKIKSASSFFANAVFISYRHQYLNNTTFSKGLLATFMILACSLITRHEYVLTFLRVCFQTRADVLWHGCPVTREIFLASDIPCCPISSDISPPPPRQMSEYEAAVQWHWQRKTEGLGEKPVPVTRCPPQITRRPPWARTLAFTVKADI